MRLRALLTAGVDAALAGCDALLLPTLPVVAPILGSPTVEIDGQSEPVRAATLRLTQMFNLTGHPAIALLAGRNTGGLPIIGVNTFLNKKGSPTIIPNEVIRSTKEEKEQQIANLHAFWKRNESKSEEALERLKEVAISDGNLFAELMETVKYCSLGQITHALYEVGGQYRRNM